MESNHLNWYTARLRQYLTPDEVKAIMRKSDLRAALEVADTWLWIAFAFALVGFFPNVFTVIISLFIIGGKQLACAILMHDCSHDSMFTSRRANQIVGNWLGAYPILQNLEQYRPYHREHHMYTGLDNDPDVSLTKGYPTTALSMMRKVGRDLIGATGVKAQIGVIAMHIGVLKYNLGGLVIRIREKRNWKEAVISAAKNLAGPVAANLIMFAILFLTGHPWLYLLWIGAMLTTYNFSLRVRSMAEHSLVDDRSNPQRNTRTTYANFIERMLFAPYHVNYHAEHHLCMGAPSYNLPAMHNILLEKGFFKEGVLENNYWSIIKLAIVRGNASS
jgi:fatty acid desaturase